MADRPTVAEAIGRDLVAQGTTHVFGLLGSGNFVVGQAMHGAGAAFHSGRHETGVVCMADGYARASGDVGVCTVHHGPGFTNALTGLAEAAKSSTPLLLITADVPRGDDTSNFAIGQADLLRGIGVAMERVTDAGTARETAARAFARARDEGRPVVMSTPADINIEPARGGALRRVDVRDPPAPADATDVARAAAMIAAAGRVVVIGGRGAVRAGARDALVELADRCGAYLATSAAAVGLFRGHDADLGLAGGFGSPIARSTIASAEVVVAAGASLNHWTTHHGAILRDGVTVIQIDRDPAAIGRHHPAAHGLVGDVAFVARQLSEALPDACGDRSIAPAEIRAGSWAGRPFDDVTGGGRIDPRTLCIDLERRLPPDRTVVIDSGQFMAFPAMYLSAPDPAGFVFSQGFMSVGLGLATAIGAAVARPDRPTVLAIGDGGSLMSLGELETLVREQLRVLVVVFNDAAYGAEVHDFRPLGYETDIVRFPETDFAAVAASLGCASAVVRDADGLATVDSWLDRADGPLVLDARIDGELLAEAWG
jgi:thiamine pyrophosphate-dependent acetolactate synthase large subunit-like protein